MCAGTLQVPKLEVDFHCKYSLALLFLVFKVGVPFGHVQSAEVVRPGNLDQRSFLNGFGLQIAVKSLFPVNNPGCFCHDRSVGIRWGDLGLVPPFAVKVAGCPHLPPYPTPQDFLSNQDDGIVRPPAEALQFSVSFAVALTVADGHADFLQTI